MSLGAGTGIPSGGLPPSIQGPDKSRRAGDDSDDTMVQGSAAQQAAKGYVSSYRPVTDTATPDPQSIATALMNNPLAMELLKTPQGQQLMTALKSEPLAQVLARLLGLLRMTTETMQADRQTTANLNTALQNIQTRLDNTLQSAINSLNAQKDVPKWVNIMQDTVLIVAGMAACAVLVAATGGAGAAIIAGAVIGGAVSGTMVGLKEGGITGPGGKIDVALHNAGYSDADCQGIEMAIDVGIAVAAALICGGGSALLALSAAAPGSAGVEAGAGAIEMESMGQKGLQEGAQGAVAGAGDAGAEAAADAEVEAQGLQQGERQASRMEQAREWLSPSRVTQWSKMSNGARALTFFKAGLTGSNPATFAAMNALQMTGFGNSLGHLFADWDTHRTGGGWSADSDKGSEWGSNTETVTNMVFMAVQMYSGYHGLGDLTKALGYGGGAQRGFTIIEILSNALPQMVHGVFDIQNGIYRQKAAPNLRDAQIYDGMKDSIMGVFQSTARLPTATQNEIREITDVVKQYLDLIKIPMIVE